MRKLLHFVLLPFLLFAMACNLLDLFTNAGETEFSAIQATLHALETETADQQAQSAATESLVSEDQPMPEPADTPSPLPNFVFEGISLNYTTDISANVWGEVQPEYIPEYVGIERPTPELIKIHFNNYAADFYYHQPFIQIIPVDRMMELDEYTTWHVNQLQQLIQFQPESLSSSDYPFLPLWNAASMYQSNLQYLDFQNGSGVRYLTQFGQAVAPVNNTAIFYTFQGLTSDARFYITAVLPVNHPGLINDYDHLDENWEGYYDPDFFEAYLEEQVTWLNSQPPGSYTPSISALDAMITSLLVER